MTHTIRQQISTSCFVVILFSGLLRCQLGSAGEILVAGSTGGVFQTGVFGNGSVGIAALSTTTGQQYDGSAEFPFAPPPDNSLEQQNGHNIVLGSEVLGLAISGQDLYAVNLLSNTVSKFDASGAVVNLKLITGLANPVGVAVSGDDVFVANSGNGTIGEYTTSGAVINASLITGLAGAESVAVSGGNLFVTQTNTGTISEYTTSGALVNPTFITGLSSPGLITIAGNDIFVPNSGNGTIGEYTTSGDVINASLVTGAANPTGVALSGGDLFVTTGRGDWIEEFTTSGALVTIDDFTLPFGIVAVVPEPGALVPMMLGAAMLLARRLAKRRRR